MGAKFRVLAVDDDGAYRHALEQIISDEFEVLTAKNSAETNHILETVEVDVLLLDIHLKGESGLKLVPKYRDINPGMVIALLSQDPLYPAYLKPGVDDYFIKGIEPRVLKEALWNALYRKRMPLDIRRRRFGLLKDFLPECLDAIRQPKVFFDGTPEEGLVECITGTLADDKEVRCNVYRLVEQDEDTFAVGVAPCIGCGRDCGFCLYGRFERVLTENEIIAQFLHGLNSIHARGIFETPRTLRPSLIFAHSGDPLIQNIHNSCGAIRRISNVKELECRSVITSCGDEKALDEFIELYIDLRDTEHYWSLFSAIETVRQKAMPATRNAKLIVQRDKYQLIAETTGFPVTGSVVFIPGINDSREDAKALWELIGHGRPFTVKLQPCNAPKKHRVHPVATKGELETFKRILVDCGFRPEQVRIRHTIGWEKYASCGNAVATVYKELSQPEN